MAQAGKAPLHRTRYVLSTLDDPTPHFGRTQHRITERLGVSETLLWDAEDLLRIPKMVVPVLRMSLDQSQCDRIVEKASGLPRFVKSCLRKLAMFPTGDGWTFDRILEETTHEVLL